MLKKNFFTLVHTFFDDPVSKPPGGTPPTAPPPAVPPNSGGGDPAPPPPNKVYTAEEVNQIINDERKRNAEATQTSINHLEELKKNATLTAKERDELQVQINTLKQTVNTKEELAKQERERLEKEHRETLERAASEAKLWRERFVNTQITREIQDAANQNDAFNSDIFVTLLKDAAEVIEVFDGENKPTGRFETRIKLASDEKGEVKTLSLTPAEAILTLKNKPERYGNLFKSNVSGGLGGNNSQQPIGNVDVTKMGPEEYRKHRKQLTGRQ